MKVIKVMITYSYQPEYTNPFWADGESNTGVKHSCCGKSFEAAKEELCNFYRNLLGEVPIPMPEEIEIKEKL